MLNPCIRLPRCFRFETAPPATKTLTVDLRGSLKAEPVFSRQSIVPGQLEREIRKSAPWRMPSTFSMRNAEIIASFVGPKAAGLVSKISSELARHCTHIALYILRSTTVSFLSIVLSLLPICRSPRLITTPKTCNNLIGPYQALGLMYTVVKLATLGARWGRSCYKKLTEVLIWLSLKLTYMSSTLES